MGRKASCRARACQVNPRWGEFHNCHPPLTHLECVAVSEERKYDVAVAYRIYPGISRMPAPIHADSKYRLAELCLRSFKASLGNLRAKVWVLLDRCPPEYETLFTTLFPAEDFVLLRLPGLGNQDTFGRQLEILTGQDAAEFVYLAEDDYFYLPDSFHLALDLLKHQPEIDFCSLADHLDLHRDEYHRHKMRLAVEQGQVWRTANGTTCTFLTRKKTLQATCDAFRCYTKIRRWNVDAAMWLSLTKHHVLNPLDLLTQPFVSRYRGASQMFAWYYNWRQIIFGRRYRLVMPVPSLATHMDAATLAPHVNWPEKFQCQMEVGK